MGKEQLTNDLWRACDILRRDNNCGGIMEYIEHLAWLLFLKFLDEQEETFASEAEFRNEKYLYIRDNELEMAEGKAINLTFLKIPFF